MGITSRPQEAMAIDIFLSQLSHPNIRVFSGAKNTLSDTRASMGIERVSSDFGGEELFDFFLTRSDGRSCPYRKNRKKKRNLNLHFGREFFHFRARVLRDEITFRHSKFLPNRDRALLECRPAESGYFLTQIVDRSSCPNCTSVMPDRESIYSSISPSEICGSFTRKSRSRSS